MLIPKHTGGDTHVIKIIAIKCYHVWFWSTYFEILNNFFLSYIHGITELYSSVIPYTTEKKKLYLLPKHQIIFYKGG